MSLLLALPAWAQSTVLFAIGDGLVAGATGAAEGSWVPVLADCLEERAPHAFTVVDRVSPSLTLGSARAGEAQALGAAVVVIALGARDVSGEWRAEPARAALTTLLADVRGARRVLLVPPVPGGAAVPGLAAYDALLVELAKANPAVERVDLLSSWPSDPAARAAMTAGASLSEQGSARVAAAVCAAVLGSG